MKNLDLSCETFISLSHGKLSIDAVISKIKSFLEEDPKSEYSLVIGTDSSEKFENGDKKRSVNLITAVVVHRKGFGGKYFWKKKNMHNIHNLRQKIYAETFESLAFAGSFVPVFKKSLNGHSPNYKLEIHVDIGEHGDTRTMIKEIVGIVTGSGFVAKTKPDSYGASFIADKHT
ncbi:MAG: ribonuclease H-like YkuK family protein [Patescibacteria group bacterium]|nr:ribonuclease H-like YkuK family protein [Patescibacteria group bacterium]